MATMTLNLKDSPTIWRFMQSDAFVRLILGPVGSGKSSGCCAELMRRATEQRPGADGIARTRFNIIRNTYRELKDTTIKTWLEWFPEKHFGPIHWGDVTHKIRKRGMEAEFLFRALDRPEDVKKVLSLEVTGSWINEAREMPLAIVNGVKDRSGRYPSMRDGGATWEGLIMDSNMPDQDHWIYKLAEETELDSRAFAIFKQPGGLYEVDGKFYPNPRAENIQNLKGGHDYYVKRAIGTAIDHIRVYYCSQYGFVLDGKPVYPEYVDAVHAATEPIPPIPGIPIIIGLDFGLTPAAAFGQRTTSGQWRWIDELVATDMGMVRFSELLKVKLSSEYRGYKFDIWGDPAGDQRSQVDERTPFDILTVNGIPANPVDTNDTMIREEAMRSLLRRMVDGKPGMIVSPKCKVLRKGMAGGFCYKRLKVAGDERYHDKRDKTIHSHVCEAGEYALVGAGEGKVLVDTTSSADAATVRAMLARRGIRY